jgi:hypothetical protein
MATRRGFLVALGAAILASVTSVLVVERRNVVPPPRPTGIKFGYGFQGAHVPDQIAATEGMVGYPVRAARYYMKWSEDLVDTEVTTSIARGQTPVIALESFDANKVAFRWTDVGAGKYDTRLQAAADQLIALGPDVRVYFEYHHECENDTDAMNKQAACGTGPAEFVSAFNHVYTFMRQAGVGSNVRIGLSLMGSTYRGGNGGYEAWMPGRFDFFAVDGYNRGACDSRNKWLSWDEIFRAAYDAAVKYNKPLVIQEWGITENTLGTGGTKAAAVREGRRIAASWAPRLELLMYSDVYSAEFDCPYAIDSSPDSLAAFREFGSDPAYGY